MYRATGFNFIVLHTRKKVYYNYTRVDVLRPFLSLSTAFVRQNKKIESIREQKYVRVEIRYNKTDKRNVLRVYAPDSRSDSSTRVKINYALACFLFFCLLYIVSADY